jgi:hypothetical protein
MRIGGPDKSVAKGPGTWVAGAALGSPPGRPRASWRLFVLSFAGATVLGVALLAPLERWESRGVLPAVVALAGTVSRVAELATVALLGAYVLARSVAQMSIRRW